MFTWHEFAVSCNNRSEPLCLYKYYCNQCWIFIIWLLCSKLRPFCLESEQDWGQWLKKLVWDHFSSIKIWHLEWRIHRYQPQVFWWRRMGIPLKFVMFVKFHSNEIKKQNSNLIQNETICCYFFTKDEWFLNNKAKKQMRIRISENDKNCG